MFKILDEKCTPKKGTKFSACVDLFAREDVVIGAGETVLVPLGVKIDQSFISMNIEELQEEKYNHIEVYADSDWVKFFKMSHQLNLHIRSSMSAKHGLIIANGTGIIDLDYPGEIMICVHNPTKPYTIKEDFASRTYVKSTDKVNIKKGQPIAQISLVEHKTYLLGVKSEEKRNGGFGSTDA